MYSEYQAERNLRMEASKESKPKDVTPAPATAKPMKDKPRKFSYKEQKEWESIEDTIANLEAQIESVQAELANGGTDYTHLQKLMAEQNRLEAELEQALERWTFLSELAEEIERNKG